jgi:hypothetical protein
MQDPFLNHLVFSLWYGSLEFSGHNPSIDFLFIQFLNDVHLLCMWHGPNLIIKLFHLKDLYIISNKNKHKLQK